MSVWIQYSVALVKSLFLLWYKYFLITTFNLLYVLVQINIHLNTLIFSLKVFENEDSVNILPFTIPLIHYCSIHCIYTAFP
jgi:hypothetical protein